MPYLPGTPQRWPVPGRDGLVHLAREGHEGTFEPVDFEDLRFTVWSDGTMHITKGGDVLLACQGWAPYPSVPSTRAVNCLACLARES